MAEKIFDVLVVGAGIIGSACAFRLTERGLSACILEVAAAPATGSTGKSAAGVRVQFSTEANVRLSWESIKEYAAFPELYGVSADYDPVGYLLLVPDAGWSEHLAAVNVQRGLGAPVEVLTLAEAQSRVPFDPSGLRGATFGPRDGVVDPHSVTLAYLSSARKGGAVLKLETEFLAAERSGGAWRVRTNRGEVRARQIVNAAGAWAGVVGERAGLNVPVKPYRRMVFVSGPLPHPHRYPLTVDLGTGFYLRSEGERLLMGRSNPDEPAGFNEGIDWNWLEPTLEVAVERFPWLAEVTLDRRASWAGYYEITPDHSPILGRMEGVEGWYNACGFSGHGVQQAPAVGRVITEEIVDGRASFVDIDEFRLERFASGEARLERHIV